MLRLSTFALMGTLLATAAFAGERGKAVLADQLCTGLVQLQLGCTAAVDRAVAGGEVAHCQDGGHVS